jgi:lipopolysaccharide export system permease protein
MRSSGLSIFQITKTAIIFGFVVSTFVFWINDKIAPSFQQQNIKIREQMESNTNKPKTKGLQILRNLTIYGSKNRLFYVNKFDPAKKTMEGIIILEHDAKQNIIKKVVANKGEFKNNLWEFYQSITYVFDENGQLKTDPQFLEEEIMPYVETPEEFINQQQSTDFMSLAQIEEYIWKLSKSGATTVIRNLKVDYYQRFTLPLTSLIIILIGIPFSFKMHRKSTGMSSFGISLFVGFIYYVLTAISVALGKAGILIPFLAVSVSHILMLLMSIYLIGKLP